MKIQSNFTAIILKAEDGTFAGYVEEVPGVISQVKTEKQALVNLNDSLQMMLRYYKAEARKLIRKSRSRIHRIEGISV
jgi:predicted RNase H-like HicB family nuclease